MDRNTFQIIENYMLEMMKDSAHDPLHIYRVLYRALEIAKFYDGVNRDVLIASCLLHDIGRERQFQNPKLCHAKEGGKMAYAFMKKLGWKEELCQHIQGCITTHRYRENCPPETLEARILFDADKLDVSGALGIARTLLYQGQVGEPLYTLDKNNEIENGCEGNESFLKEYHVKLLPLYGNFYTKEASEIAQKRLNVTTMFYDALLQEINMDGMDELLDLKE